MLEILKKLVIYIWMSVISPLHVTATEQYLERDWEKDVEQVPHQNQDEYLVCLLSKHKCVLYEIKHKIADSNNKILLK
jgi:hypothetical protein